MPLLIDCYNVLHATMPPSLAGLDERGLCLALARSHWAGESAVVVCDGVVKPRGPAQSPAEGVELIYAGRGKSADDEIIARLQAYSAPRRLIVVSSDREIQKAAGRRRAQVMSSDEFVRVLAGSVAGKPGKAGGGGGRPDMSQPLPPEQVEKWLKEFGIGGEEDEKKRRR